MEYEIHYSSNFNLDAVFKLSKLRPIIEYFYLLRSALLNIL
jgi:hypothetical protein